MLEEAGELEDSVSKPPVSTTCRWPGCDQKIRAQGLCTRDLGRAYSHIGREKGPVSDEEVAAAHAAWETRHAPPAPVEEDRQVAVPPAAVAADGAVLARERRQAHQEGQEYAALLIRRALSGKLEQPAVDAGRSQPPCRALDDQIIAVMDMRDQRAASHAQAAKLIDQALDGQLAESMPNIHPKLAHRLILVRAMNATRKTVTQELHEALAGMRRTNEALAPLVERYKTSSIGAICECVLADLKRLDVAAEEFAAVRAALNVAPPSASDVPADCPPAEVARIVRVRTELLLDERDQRVALARQLEDAESRARNSHEAAQMWRHDVCVTLGVDPANTGLGGVPLIIAQQRDNSAAVDVLATWLYQGSMRDEVVTAAIYAVGDQLVPAEALVEALHDRRALARLVLGTSLPAPTL